MTTNLLCIAGVVQGAGHCEELLHAVHLHLDVGRGLLPAAPPHQHLEGEEVAGTWMEASFTLTRTWGASRYDVRIGGGRAVMEKRTL